ncbi:MAG: 16S rRNA (adenine(1518)-N(6)/adenine(1519)-N(6))-dimethyltransferase RsmA [Candidatus Hadarchaeales archaeon]
MEVLKLLQRRGIRPSKRAGQHFLVVEDVLRRMVEYAELSPQDTVLEIGAGIGNLTTLLAERAGKVLALEKDRRLLPVLRERLSGYDNVELMNVDFLKAELPPFNKVVSNLPFQISSKATFKLLGMKFELAVLTYQREFARRLVASPGSEDYGRLTVAVGMRAEVELMEEVSPACFFPPPKVSSAIVRLRPRPPPLSPKNWETFDGVLRALFQHRRQKVRNALFHSLSKLWPGTSKREARSLLARIPSELLEKRVLDLKPEEIVRLSDFTSP